MKRKIMLGLGSALACLAIVGCQTASTRETSPGSAGTGWNSPVARTNSPIGKPTPAAQSQWPNGPSTPGLNSPTPANQVSPARLQTPVPGNFPPPSDPSSFAAPAPGAPANPNFAAPSLDPPGPGISNNHINSSQHPTGPGLPQPISGIPNLPPPPPPIVP